MLTIDPYSTARTLRQRAFDRLSELAVSSKASKGNVQLDKVRAQASAPKKTRTSGNGSRANGDGASPAALGNMGVKELEVLLSLARAAKLAHDIDHARRLVEQLGPYLEEAQKQSFKPSPHLKAFGPSPWELVAHDVTAALLVIGSMHPSLRDVALTYIKTTVNAWLTVGLAIIKSASELQDEVNREQSSDVDGDSVRLCLVIIGTLSALSEHADVLTPPERFSLLQEIHGILSEDFMVNVEAILAGLRNSSSHDRDLRPWKRVLTLYASTGRPLGALILQQSFMHLIASYVETSVAPRMPGGIRDTLAYLLDAKLPLERYRENVVEGTVEKLAGYVIESLAYLEADASFLRVTSVWQQRLAFSMKAYALKSFLYLSLFEDNADADVLMGYLEAVIADQTQLADDELAQTALKCMVVIARAMPAFALPLGRSWPQLIVQGRMTPQTAGIAADCLARVLVLLPQDVLISTLYALVNILLVGTRPTTSDSNPTPENNFATPSKTFLPLGNRSQASSLSIGTTDFEDMATSHGTVVQAIVSIATRSNDEKIIRLAVSLLLQKLDRGTVTVSARILKGVSQLALLGTTTDLRSLLRIFTRVASRYPPGTDDSMRLAIADARLSLAHGTKKDSPLYEAYLGHLLDAIVTITGSADGESRTSNHKSSASIEISQYLDPLAVLISSSPNIEPQYEDPKQIINLARDAWYNLVAHDYTLNSTLAQEHNAALETLALHSPALVGEDRLDVRESSLELNTVLKRNMNPSHLAEQRQALLKAFPAAERQIADLEYSELTFLNAAHLIAVLRARAGTCTRTMEYFTDDKFKSGSLGSLLMEIAVREVEVFLNHTFAAKSKRFGTAHLAGQLVILFQGCCHRIPKVRHVALKLADHIITSVPSALCQQSSVFALLELLTLMWTSCLDEEMEDIEWQTKYTSKRGGVSIELSDDFADRRDSLTTFLKYARTWLTRIVESMPLDIKALLQTYLSEFDAESAYGHVALGRSLATEFGCLIPKQDLRIGNMDTRLDIGINSASEFIAQYTTRQQYRTIDSFFESSAAGGLLQMDASDYILAGNISREIEDAVKTLRLYGNRLRVGETVPLAELRPALSKAAALLCRSDVHDRELAHLLVEVPCQLWTKEALKVGVSLWMGVVRENGRFESQIVLEVLAQHELSIRSGRTGLTPSPQQTDPFFGKHEFAPSERSTIKRRQQYTSDIISPIVRLYQFLTSHFHATLYAAPLIKQAYLRTIQTGCIDWMNSTSQPITREMHFKWVLSVFKVARDFNFAGDDFSWMYRDSMLSFAFKWFALPPRWSFGGNKLQVKAGLRAMSEVLRYIEMIKAKTLPAARARRMLSPRFELLSLLIQDEIQRLSVWLSPLSASTNAHHGLHLHSQNDKKPEASGDLLVQCMCSNHSQAAIHPLIPIAWAESPSLAIQLVNRFRTATTVSMLRDLLTKEPEKALGEPEAVPFLLGVAGQPTSTEHRHLERRDAPQHARHDIVLPKNVSDKSLRFLLYWSAVSPITAVTYFSPAFGNNPNIIQYAVRALEWHSVDVNFFFVPQIVQALRNDSLGYVKRYIIETAKFSQLFAHQIIWNIKANAYKDDNSEVPDPMKPTLDIVMESLISSFSPEDRLFYVREFDFFDKVTGISGTLKPLIKRPKPEKKQKIEEELRKIKVDVGVYLPSNPDGVVVGIDRQSGKPLQSHAKAPFMATFRIRKERKDDELLSPKAGQKAMMSHQRNTSVDTSSGAVKAERKEQAYYETWQSAIFKVGDDCRQDVLALQLISTFRSIFNNVGLDVYVFPYRVTATAPGCGVIDVLPNSISRDMLGREQVNGLFEYFLSHFGTEDSLAFQQARANFVKSMAAYSVISYLLQFKDRHNGNIMIDDQGHILHIDFGFLFDIAPGGVKFERSPFKLTSEMVAVMGGSVQAAPYLRFEELCVKAFLASRPYADKLASLVTPMLESGLPCFKPETVKHLRERFVLDKSEREAAEFMRMLIRKSEGSFSTKGYDQFQLLTNGIPY